MILKKIFLVFNLVLNIQRLFCYFDINFDKNQDVTTKLFKSSSTYNEFYLFKQNKLTKKSKNKNDEYDKNVNIFNTKEKIELQECITDSNCINSHYTCLNKSCVKICNQLDRNANNDCIYFHCDSKSLITSNNLNYFAFNKSINNCEASYLIETNNYPMLNSYLGNKKCSWILKSQNNSLSSIELNFERFNTELANDYLYIFDGDSIYSRLVAAISGNGQANLNPSLVADKDEDDFSFLLNKKMKHQFNVTFLNTTNLFLLFKSDHITPFTNLKSNVFFKPQLKKPEGISIKCKFSVPCKSQLSETSILFEKNETFFRPFNNNYNKTKLVETINYVDFEDGSNINNLHSKLRRGLFCSFKYNNFYYVIGGYSFYGQMSFISRLNLKNFNWDHSFDRKKSTVLNRSNRKYFSSINFKEPKLDLPEPRYAHSCVLDGPNNHFYMYGGIKYITKSGSLVNKQTTDELWSYNLNSNKWYLLNSFEQINDQTGLNESKYSINPDQYHVNTNSTKNYALPIAVSGHSMQILNKSLYIFYGYSEFYGSTLNLIQEYKLDKKTWHLFNTTDIKLGYKHGSTIDVNKKIVYFYGGIYLDSQTEFSPLNEPKANFDFPFIDSKKWQSFSHKSSNHNNILKISSHIYSFDLTKFEWEILSESKHSNYMQSFEYYNQTILCYGGIVSKNSSDNNEISNRLQIFDINKKIWLKKYEIKHEKLVNFKNSVDKLEFARRERYGHGSFIHNDALFIFAGFNGFFLNDLFKLNLTNLVYYQDMKLHTSKKRKIRQHSSSPNKNYVADDDVFGNKIAIKSHLIKYENFNHHKSLKDKINVLESEKGTKNSKQDIFDSCERHLNCNYCNLDSNCIWNLNKCEYFFRDFINMTVYKKPDCSKLCSHFTSCYNCTQLSNIEYYDQNECVWCSTQAKCLLKHAINIYYPFGECFNFISDKLECNNNFNHKNERNHYTNNDISSDAGLTNIDLPISGNFFPLSYCASHYPNCSSCIKDEKCGWCSKDFLNDQYLNLSSNKNSDLLNFSLNTGYGSCMEGGASGSISNRCKLNWFFTKCPLCECNGHSTCSNQFNLTDNYRTEINPTDSLLLNFTTHFSSQECTNCLNNTDGEYCSLCKKGYFGNAKNNGTCTKCECNGQADSCDSSNGRCFCNTKGVIGIKCDQCDQPRYTGRPNLIDGSCFYNLTTDYQFTFNLNKDSDKFYTKINFVNHPTRNSDDDIDFMVRCFRENALINVTYVTQFNQIDLENYLFLESNVDFLPSLSRYSDIEWPFNILNNFSNIWLKKSNKSSAHQNNDQSFSARNIFSDSENYFMNGLNINESSVLQRQSVKKLESTSKTDPNSIFSLSSFNNYNYYFGSYKTQVHLLAQINCTSNEFKYTFTNRDLNYADKSRNPVFIVYVYNFQSPITIQIAFSRKSRVQLLHFFITFFGCLLSLLTIAFITWKTKQRYDRFRRQRQIVIQMENMASRPFTRLLLEVTKKENDSKVFANESKDKTLKNKSLELAETNSKNKPFNVEFKCTKKKAKKYDYSKVFGNFDSSSMNSKVNSHNNNSNFIQNSNNLQKPLQIMPVAVEPLNNSKSAILTCLIKLPQGSLNFTPKGSSPLVLASTYVQITSSSKFLQTNNGMLSNESIMFEEDDEEHKANEKNEK